MKEATAWGTENRTMSYNIRISVLHLLPRRCGFQEATDSQIVWPRWTTRPFCGRTFQIQPQAMHRDGEERRKSQDTGTLWKLCMLTWSCGTLLGFLDRDKLSAAKTMIPEFGKSTTQKASDRGCVEIVFGSSTSIGLQTVTVELRLEKPPHFFKVPSHSISWLQCLDTRSLRTGFKHD